MDLLARITRELNEGFEDGETYRICDYCNCHVPAGLLKLYKESGMEICEDCQPEYERVEEEETKLANS